MIPHSACLQNDAFLLSKELWASLVSGGMTIYAGWLAFKVASSTNETTLREIRLKNSFEIFPHLERIYFALIEIERDLNNLSTFNIPPSGKGIRYYIGLDSGCCEAEDTRYVERQIQEIQDQITAVQDLRYNLIGLKIDKMRDYIMVLPQSIIQLYEECLVNSYASSPPKVFSGYSCFKFLKELHAPSGEDKKTLHEDILERSRTAKDEVMVVYEALKKSIRDDTEHFLKKSDPNLAQ